MKPPPPSVLASRPPLSAPKKGYLAVCPLTRLAVDGPSWDPTKNWAAVRLELAFTASDVTLREKDAFSKNNESISDGDGPNYPQGTRLREVLVTARRDGEILAFSNLCPHQGYPFHAGGDIVDIEDTMFGKVAGVACQRHGWTFDLLSGSCLSSRHVLDIFGAEVHNFVGLDGDREPEPWVFISKEPVNDDVEGKRNDFGGRAVWGSAKSVST